MKQPIVIAALASLLFLLPLQAEATLITCSGQPVVTLVAGNQTTDSANLIYIYSSCTGICTGGQAYIDFSDKAIFAQALVAKAKSLTVDVRVDNAATAKGTAANGTTTCRITSLWY